MPRAEPPHLVSSPLLAKLLAIGTEHVYADTADIEELRALLSPRPGTLVAEVDGNTVNQPLVRRVLDRYVVDEALAEQSRVLRDQRPAPSHEVLARQLYTAVCMRIGVDVVRAFAAGRAWEPSLQLHMGACRDRAAAVALGHRLREPVPNCLVKVPFLPSTPHDGASGTRCGGASFPISAPSSRAGWRATRSTRCSPTATSPTSSASSMPR